MTPMARIRGSQGHESGIDPRRPDPAHPDPCHPCDRWFKTHLVAAERGKMLQLVVERYKIEKGPHDWRRATRLGFFCGFSNRVGGGRRRAIGRKVRAIGKMREN